MVLIYLYKRESPLHKMNDFGEKTRDKLYKEHRRRVLNAKSVVTTFEPKAPAKEPGPNTIEGYLAQIVDSVRPRVFTFTKSPEVVSMTQLGSWDHIRPRPVPVARAKKLKSRTLCQMKKKLRAYTPQEMYTEDGQLHISSKSEIDDHIPRQILQRYREASGIPDDMLLSKLLRPKIFLEFYSIKTAKTVGHLEIQLFTEACPAIVLEFVRMCSRGERERLWITHVVDMISVECELALDDDNVLSDESFDYDTETVDHGSGAGILTCPLRYVHGTRNNRLRFSITLRPLKVLNGKRVAFGKAFGDIKLLQRIHNLAKSKTGNIKFGVKTCGIEK